MKLELKHLSPYLPYGLNGIDSEHNDLEFKLEGFVVDVHQENALNPVWYYRGDRSYISPRNNYEAVKPIMRHLSDLLDDINFKQLLVDELISENFRTIYDSGSDMLTLKTSTGYSEIIYMHGELCDECTVMIYKFMCKNHYDFNGLIDAGLAIDINTLND